MTTFDHRERLHLSLTSPQHVNVELEATSVLECGALKECLSLVSPFRSDILQLLIDHDSVKRLRWESSSQSSNTLTLLSRNSSPSGFSVEVEFDGLSDDDRDTFSKILKRLQDDRLLLAPLESISQKRLHRHILQNQTTFRVSLPMDGSGVTSEALQANLPTCGLWSLADADTWSSYLLGTHQDMAQSQRRTWIDVSKECINEKCSVTFKQGIAYGRRRRRASLKLNQVLPGDSVSSCPWTTKTKVEVTRPKYVDVTFAMEAINAENTGLLQTTTHVLPLSLSIPFLRVKESSTSWSDVTYGRIDKTIRRPQGMAYVGSLVTTVTNDDVYEARVTLYDILPTYIRPTSVDMSLEASRSYHPLNTDLALLQHDFILPPQTSARLTVGYEPILLPFQHFPPDPNRGIEMPPSWAVWNATETLYSPSLLLLPPVPDMSMPFNVISMTCTLYAFIIGSIINTIVRRGEDKVYYQLYPEKKPKTVKEKLKEKVGRLKEKFLGRRKKEEAKETDKKDEVNQETEEPMDDDWVPEAKLQKDDSDTPYLLTQAQRQSLASDALPTAVADRRWKRLYSSERDGDSFEAFLAKVKGESPTVLVVKTTKDHLVGGYADHAWERQKDYYGSGQACLFKMEGEKAKVYKWTGANRLVQHIDGTKSRIIMGGGSSGGFGLCVEENFSRGSTSRCETFENEPLCPDHMFEVLSCEVYGFVRGTF